ncbi:MAG: DUF5658 family protein [Promethearchaeota archaeon]
MEKKRLKSLFLTNNFFISCFFILKLTDIIITLQYVKLETFCEGNPFAVQLIENPLVAFFLLFILTTAFAFINMLIYHNKNFNCLQELFLILIIFSNLISFLVIMDNLHTITVMT